MPIERQAGVQRIGYFGSYATGRAGVGSDLDVVVVIDASNEPFARRGVSWDTTMLPVPVDLLIYTEAEWQALVTSDRRFGRELGDRTIWLAVRRTAATLSMNPPTTADGPGGD
ncbi:MAG: nucleotidyltransferase domain-containing protein [Vicinamibacterales bacterium]